MTIVATVGLVANIIGTWLLHRGSKDSMNLRAAYLHLFSDGISSIGVILGGLAIIFLGIYWIDPLLTVLIALYVLKESLQILWRTLDIFFLATPADLDLNAIRKLIREQDGVDDVHHIHLWPVSETDIHFEGHVTIADQLISQVSVVREKLEALLHEKFGINHATIQFEAVSDPCGTANLS